VYVLVPAGTGIYTYECKLSRGILSPAMKRKTRHSGTEGLEKQLAKYREQYRLLREQSPDRWWHDEHFDSQLRFLETLIAETKEQILLLKGRRGC